MSKNFPKKIDAVTIKNFYALMTFLFFLFCDHKKNFILKKYLEFLYDSKLYGNIWKQYCGKKWQNNIK